MFIHLNLIFVCSVATFSKITIFKKTKKTCAFGFCSPPPQFGFQLWLSAFSQLSSPILKLKINNWFFEIYVFHPWKNTFNWAIGDRSSWFVDNVAIFLRNFDSVFEDEVKLRKKISVFSLGNTGALSVAHFENESKDIYMVLFYFETQLIHFGNGPFGSSELMNLHCLILYLFSYKSTYRLPTHTFWVVKELKKPLYKRIANSICHIWQVLSSELTGKNSGGSWKKFIDGVFCEKFQLKIKIYAKFG